MLILQDALSRLEICPELGGALANWQLLDNGAPLFRPCDSAALAAGTPRRLGCFPLLPWSNRIGSGGFANPDGWLALTANSEDPLPIHGSAWQQAWQVEQHDRQQAVLHLDSCQPFAYQARQHIRLRDGQLDITLQVMHRDAAAAWYGIGLHPYFPRTTGTRLQASAEAVWLCDEQHLSHELVALPPGWDYCEEQQLVSGLDHAFNGWNGLARIVQPELGYQLDCRAHGAELFLLFTPSEREFFCLEPVSHPVNAHHLPGRPGLHLLHQGQSLHLGWSLRCQLR